MKKNQMIIGIIFILCALSLTGCDQQSGKSKNPESLQAKSPVPQVEIDTLSNNLARLIGGKEVPFDPQNNWDANFIKGFAAITSSKVAKIKEERLNKMTQWNKENLTRNNTAPNSFVFYPFSGGDFIHVNALYPDASEYLLVAREDVGDVPNLFTKDAAFVNEYLKDIDTVLRDIYTKSYFITKNMIEDTKKRTLVNGMLPLILWAAVNSDHEIVGYRFLEMNDSINELVPFSQIKQGKKPDAVEINLKIAGTQKIRKVTYISCDISDDGFESRSSFFKYLEKKVPVNCNSFVKSASYLMHYITFSKIRGMVLTKSKYLLQDDTGIPYQYFNPNQWQVSLFGIYETPVKDFHSSLFQKDLSLAYNDSILYKGNINFSLGYHWGSRKQNQLIAVKK
jgi:hypothetical protein